MPLARGLAGVYTAIANAVAALSAGMALYATDLDNGPKTGGQNGNGAPITLYGRFGPGPYTVTLGGGAVATIVSSSSSKIVVELGAAVATGNFAVTNSAGETCVGCIDKPYGTSNDFTVNAKLVKFIAATGTNGTGTYPSPYVAATNRIRDNFASGDIWVFLAGTYTAELCVNGWAGAILNLGGSYSGVQGASTAFIAYPGATVTFDGSSTGHNMLYMRDSAETVADYITLAGIVGIGGDQCVGHGGQTGAGIQVQNDGCNSQRIVGCTMSAVYTNNTQTGLCTVGGNGGRIHFNTLKDSGLSSFENQNHGLYIQLGPDDVRVSFNMFQNLNMGSTCQIHTDKYFQYTNIHVHSNTWNGNDTYSMRGITCGNASAGSTIYVYNNTFYKVGEGGYGWLNAFSGDFIAENNTVVGIKSGNDSVLVGNNNTGAVGWAQPTVTLKNNLVSVASGGTYIGFYNGATSAQGTLDFNLWDGAGTGPAADTHKVSAAPLLSNPSGGDFALQSGSPAKNAGTASISARVAVDRFGVARPQGTAPDIGACESIAPAMVATQQSAAIAQLWSGTNWSPTTIALTGVTVGNLIIVYAGWWDDTLGSGAAQQAPTDSNGTLVAAVAPVLAGATAPTGWTVGARIDYIASANAGTHTITPPNIGPGGDGYIALAEFYAPGSTWAKIDQGTTKVGSASPGGVTTITVTTDGAAAQVGDLVVAIVLTDGNPNAAGVGSPVGYPNNLLTTSTTSDNIGLGSGWKAATTAGAQSATWSWADTDQQVAVADIAVFRRT